MTRLLPEITEEDVLNVLPKLNPRRKNPTGRYSCVYTDRKNPDRHCIAGEVLIQLGHANLVPGAADSSNEGVSIGNLLDSFRDRVLITGEANVLLQKLQNEADEKITWKRAIEHALLDEWA